jgi:hypothetical protein
MKFYITLVFIILIFGCASPSKTPAYDSFKNINGFIYFSYPETGGTITGVFVPYNKQANHSIDDIFTSKYSPGIKFSTNRPSVFNLLAHSMNNYGYVTNDSSRKVYIVPNVGIGYHLSNANKNSWFKTTLNFDTLLLKKRSLAILYYFSYVEIDTIIKQ